MPSNNMLAIYVMTTTMTILSLIVMFIVQCIWVLYKSAIVRVDIVGHAASARIDPMIFHVFALLTSLIYLK